MIPLSSQRWPPTLTCLLLLFTWVIPATSTSDSLLSTLRQDTRDLFYHGYSNYMRHAFPEDEIKPLTCQPQTRNRDDPTDIGINDALGNYSLTLIDSLSTLAILASGEEDGKDGRHALWDFQDGVKALTEAYGDGSEGSCGTRACGFDLDSKVQVFETNIRGVGGLLSAHLFAVGELPIRGYEPAWVEGKHGRAGIWWNHAKFVYDGQLLRLAHDLASRLLPAFSTEIGLPYPRVNLKYGIPFYQDAEEGICRLDGSSTNPREITETCAAGAGSLVLEFTTLSRLTGNLRFENVAKEAFFAIWSRRSNIDLVAGGIDAESGQWVMPPLSGIGASIDSFFEYALKSHILLSGLPPLDTNSTDPSKVDNADSYLDVWLTAHSAISHHILRSHHTEKHPYYGQSDFLTGAPRYNWIDNLSAYYPGLLVLAGQLEEAISSHLLFSALWTRYSALPERWHVTSNGGFIDNNFKHWAGRPEFVESTWYLYRATKDPWLVHVGEMVLRDVRRRCWAKCGWAGLRDVLASDDQARGDRMESFFLGETAKYLYLLFDEDHPLNGNGVDGVVFSTEGHPLMIPRRYRHHTRKTGKRHAAARDPLTQPAPVCEVPPASLPLTFSNIASRSDLFHAAALTNLHLVPSNPARSSPIFKSSDHSPGISIQDLRSPTNYSFYPWTLPTELIPVKGQSSPIRTSVMSTLTFPDLNALASQGDNQDAPNKGMPPLGALRKVLDGVLIDSLSNIRLNMIQEPRSLLIPDHDGTLVEQEVGRAFRVSGIANWALGRDEKVLVSSKAVDGLIEGGFGEGGEMFRRMRDLEWVDLVIDLMPGEDSVGEQQTDIDAPTEKDAVQENSTLDTLWQEVEQAVSGLLSDFGVDISHLILPDTASHPSAPKPHPSTPPPSQPTFNRHLIPAILPTGPGAAPLPSIMEHPDPLTITLGSLPKRSTYFLDSTLCHKVLPTSIAREHSILVIRRGGCSFSDKLANIPAFPPSEKALQLVVVLDDTKNGGGDAAGGLVRPWLDETQRTPRGLLRRYPIGMVLVDGDSETERALRSLAGSIGRWEGEGEFHERKVDTKGKGAGLVVKRRYWFESQGVPIGNLIML